MMYYYAHRVRILEWEDTSVSIGEESYTQEGVHTSELPPVILRYY